MFPFFPATITPHTKHAHVYQMPGGTQFKLARLSKKGEEQSLEKDVRGRDIHSFSFSFFLFF